MQETWRPRNTFPPRYWAASPFREGGFCPTSPPSTLHDCVEYRFSGDGPFVGEARVIEVLPDGRYRLERLDGAPFSAEGSIFREEQLRLKPSEA